MKERIKEFFPGWKLLVVALTVSLFVSAITQESISPRNETFPIVFSALELVALILPALAIMSQITIRLANHDFFRLTQTSSEIRRLSMTVLGGGGLALSLAIFILIAYLDLPLPLYISMLLISFTVIGFSSVPLAIAYYIHKKDNEDIMKSVDLFRSIERLSEVEDMDEEYFKVLEEQAPWPNEEAIVGEEPEGAEE